MRRCVGRRTRPTSSRYFGTERLSIGFSPKGIARQVPIGMSATGGQQAQALAGWGGFGCSAGGYSVQLSASEHAHAKELIPMLLEQIGTNERFKDEFR